jgi:aryl-alcohol dehydrogenase-like predicted oxidoreductase
MAKRKLGGHDVEPIGLGCMPLSHAYGTPPPEAAAARLLHEALDLGYDHLDTASLYGMGHNERLIGEALKRRRSEFILASKCGIRIVDGERRVDASPDAVREVLDDSLGRLGVEFIDLYYLHRVDPKVPVEDSVGALADAVRAGKIGAVGLSEVSAATLRRAHAVHPIAAVQTEYSLWTRNPEIAVLDTCRELGATFVAFSPVGRGALTDAPPDPANLAAGDIRKPMPRFAPEHWTRNREMLAQFRQAAHEAGCTAAQAALAWVLSRGPHVVAIPGTTSPAHLAENLGARELTLEAEFGAKLDTIVNQRTVSGGRYPAAVQATIDTEEFV